MERLVIFSAACLAVIAQSLANSAYGGTGYGTAPGNMSAMNMNMSNFNLSTPQGIQAFLQMENINPASLITTNCIANGNSCAAGGGKPCCLSPVFSCQGSPGSCKVVPQHTNHIPQIQQIVQTAGVTTQNPIQ